MQILNETDSVSRFIGNLSISLAADPASWGDWHAIIICAEAKKNTPLDPMIHSHLCHVSRATLNGCDGVILQLGSNTAVVVSQHVSRAHLKNLRHAIDEASSDRWSMLTLRHFPLLEDMETIEDLARLYATPHDRLNTVEPVEFDALKAMVPHISDLLKAWMATHKPHMRHEKPCVLVVDDDPVTRHVVSRALKNDYPMATAASVPEAIEKHLLLAPDIVFVDIEMPECDGFMLLSYIRAYDPACRVIMFSSNSYVDNRVKAFAAGAAGFIDKPFNRFTFDRYINMCKPDHNVLHR